MKMFETWPAFSAGSLWNLSNYSLQSTRQDSCSTRKYSVIGGLNFLKASSANLLTKSISSIKDFNIQTALFLRSVIEKVYKFAISIFVTINDLKGYIIGPAVSLLGASIVRLSLGKRAPSAGPLYIAAFMATTILITVWTIQFFKHPKYKKIMQDRGVKEAMSVALPFPKPKIVEPLHSRHLLSNDRIDALLQTHKTISLDTISESEAKNALTVFKQYCDWVKKKIKIDRVNQETLKILQTTLLQHLAQVLKSLVIYGNRSLIENLLDFNSKDPFVKRALSLGELQSLYYQFGARLSQILRKDDLTELFPVPEKIDADLAVMDALMSSNTDKVMDITTTSVVDPHKIFIYGSKDDALLDSLNFKLSPMNLMQAAVLSGDTESLKRLIASTSDPCDWTLKDSRGLSYFALAALSGSKAMWDFINEFCQKRPLLDDVEYLYLFYAAIKSDSVEIFEELFNPLFEEDYKDLTGALVLDLYEKAVSYGSNEIIRYLEKSTQIENELKKTPSIKTILKASIIGSHQGLFERFFTVWQKEAKDNALAMKEVYECLLNAEKPSVQIFDALDAFEKTFNSSYQKLQLDVSSLGLLNVMQHLSDDAVAKLMIRVAKDQVLRFMGEKGPFFAKVVCRPKVLEVVLTLCSDAKFLITACAKEAIKLAHHDSLRLLCAKGLDVIKKLPDSHESLLSYVMLSLNPAMIDIILGHSPPLSQVLIAQLKERVTTLKCHKEDETASAMIIRMLDAKSLERGSALVEDPQIHLALVKAGAMEFTIDPSVAPKEDASRGLVSAGLSYLGLL